MPRGKPSNGKGASRGAPLPVLVDLRSVKALDHVLRQHILLATTAGEISPSELSKALGEGLSQVSYHVKVLRDDCDGIIEETRTEPRRGAVEHYYRASEKSLFPAKSWRRLKKGLRAVVGAGQASDLFNDLADALNAGKLQGAHDHIIRTPLLLDAKGERNVKAIAERATKEIENEQRETGKRIAKTDGKGGGVTAYTFALLAFEAAWEAADLRVSEAHAKKATKGSASGGGRKDGERKRGRRNARAGSK
jgi:DNA-binding transcriptional ArsR family regulator